MKKAKIVVSVVVIILAVAMIGCVLASCSVRNQIIGEWKSNVSSEYQCYFVLVFHNNGTYSRYKYSSTLDILVSKNTGKYTIKGNTIECHVGENEAIIYKYNNGKITTGIYTYVKQK